jgi:glycerol-3-phosphate dehydrogenase
MAGSVATNPQQIMKREDFIARLSEPWDVAVIGGGATGLGTAVDAASRGLKVVLLEQGDFAQATSSRSTKLIHGGVRYLKQGNLALVRDALHERGLLLRNAPHLVHPLPFVIPAYGTGERFFYGAGLKAYDLLAGKLGIAPSRTLSREETFARLPGIRPEGLRGGVLYHDAQFDDAGLAISLARTLALLGGAPINYLKVVALKKGGLRALDLESGREHEIRAKVVINATGVFADEIRRLDEPTCEPMLAPSQGAHLVLPREFLPGENALMIPKTDDGRVLFAIPWFGRVLLGTTDTPVDRPVLEPVPLESEVDFLLHHARRYLRRSPDRSHVHSMFAGLRPLVKHNASRKTSALSRDHIIRVSSHGLVTITGGKWTTYRRMGEDAVNVALKVAELSFQPSRTENLELAKPDAESDPILRAIRTEMARTVEDVLARRTRELFLDVRASLAEAPRVALILASELGKDGDWENGQIEAFRRLASTYLPHLGE